MNDQILPSVDETPETSSIDKMKEVYANAFDAFERAIANKSMPKKFEGKPAAIKANAEYSTDDYFSVNIKGAQYKFFADELELNEFSETSPFSASHEITHAIIEERRRAGKFNIGMLRHKLSSYSIKISDKVCYHSTKGLEHFDKDNYFSMKFHDAAHFCWKQTGKVFDKLWGMVNVREEFLCDKYAITAFPDTDLEKLHSEYVDSDPTSDLQEDKPVINTHPSGEARMRRLTKLQQRLKKGR